jgi:hypothetical protein
MARPPSNTNKTNISPDLVENFLNNQAKELELKATQLSLQKQGNDNGFEFGKAALKAKAEDRNLQRKHDLKIKVYTYQFIGIIILLIAGIVFYAMYSDNKDIAMEIIKAIVYLVGGGLGGYGAAKASESKFSTENSSER